MHWTISRTALIARANVAAGLRGFCFLSAGLEKKQQLLTEPPMLLAVGEDLLELKRGNLLLEREKLSLEIQILRMKMAKMNCKSLNSGVQICTEHSTEQ